MFEKFGHDFYINFIKDDRYTWLLDGLKNTMIITVFVLKMENDSTLLPSMLCAPTREAVSEWLYRHHDVPAEDRKSVV